MVVNLHDKSGTRHTHTGVGLKVLVKKGPLGTFPLQGGQNQREQTLCHFGFKYFEQQP